MTIAENIAKAITQAEAEVARLKTSLADDIQAAEARLEVLKLAATRVTPTLESLFLQLRKFGIRFDD